MIINLFSGPRNISTTLMYSFAQRSDMEVIDEPFYAYHLKHHNIDHPGKEETLQVWPNEAEEVYQWIEEKAAQTDHLFLKNMPHHVVGADLSAMNDYRHLFLIRDPARMITSFTKVIQHPAASDFALEDQWKWFSKLEAEGRAPLVVNAHTILTDPKTALQRLCEALGLPFEEAMLSWPEGPKEEDGPWAPYWYANVHQSSGFGKPRLDAAEVAPEYRSLYETLLPFYQQLNSRAIQL